MTRILFLLSSAHRIVLADGSSHEAGVFASDTLKPYERFAAAGAEIAVATVDGKPPQLDPYGLELLFHYPDEDTDFLASVTRTFMRRAEDIRITLQHLSELDLIAARRIFEALKSADTEPEKARILIEQMARKAWSESANFVTLLSSYSEAIAKVSVTQLRESAGAVQADAKKCSDRLRQRFSAIPSFQRPLKLSDLSDEEMLEYDTVFIPGGYGPMVDLAENPDVLRLLCVMHDRSRIVAAIGHGPAALLSAPHRADGLWLFDGYRMTGFTDEEEDQTRLGKLGMAWHLEAALKNRGAVIDHALAAWASHVVVDRNLITGQNPASANATADAVLKRVGVRGKGTINIAPRYPALSQSEDFEPRRQRNARWLALQLCDRLHTGDADGARSLIAPDAVVDFGPVGGSGIFAYRGAKLINDLVTAFPGLRVTIRSMVADSETAVVEVTIAGTQRADFVGIHNQEKHLDLDQAWVITTADGMIANIRTYWCQNQLYRRLAVNRLDQISITG
jgi:putative intracellular protease/amidase/ketosteroid isomerase-like protein